MAKVRMMYVKSYKDRHGKVRHYFRRRGFDTVTLPGDPGSVEFATAYEAAKLGSERRMGADRYHPRSFSALIAEYYETASYVVLADITKRTYRNVLERFREGFGSMLVREMTPGRIDELMDSTRANRVTLRKVLNLILKLAVRREWVATNPLDGVRLPRKALKGFHDWTDAEIAMFEDKWATGTRERLALALLLYTVQRRGDVVIMGRQHVRGGKIYVAQAKSGGRTRLALPVHPALKVEIDALPAGQLTFLQTAHGKPFSPAGFTTWFGEAADEAGLAGCTPHGLRKAGARRMAEMGGTAKQIMAVTGHANLSEVTLYTAAADQVRLAEEAFALLETGTKRLTGVSTP